MKIFLSILIAIVISYCLGSVNFSIIVVKLVKGEDIRELGSKNAGLTNTLRCAGKFCALLTLIGDVMKGILSVGISTIIASALNAGFTPDNDVMYIGYIAGISAVMGHIFPVYYNFRGGKGVLTAATAFAMIDIKIFIAIFAVFVVVVAVSKYVSLGSVFSAVLCPVAVFMMSFVVDDVSLGKSVLYTILSLVMAVTVVWKHKPNIERFMAGNENKLSFGSGKIPKK
ncbi:MAG: glycerol-3-phosphate 1-O-acyltransferase PlsY [Ruminococcus sp.]|nr:glycerol-3-phosphate 1-O-acyltransferase PlsY [Ruminococcus sp.]